MNLWLHFWTLAMLLSGGLFLAITLVVAAGGLRDLRQMLHGFSQKPLPEEEPKKKPEKRTERRPMASRKPDTNDAFVAMMTAHAEADLRLTDFAPQAMLRTTEHRIATPRFPVIDFHNHIDGLDPEDVLRVMDACQVEHLVNITMQTGAAGLASIARLRAAAPDRFSSIAWMDWSGVDQHDFDDFMSRALDQLEAQAAAGVCGLKIWKDLGLRLRDHTGKLLRIDDPRLAPLFDRAASLGLFVIFHTADPAAFFLPIDARNERYEELAAHPDWSFHGSTYSKAELMEQRDRVFARHPKTQFVAAHMGEQPEDLQALAAVLDAYPNLQLDLSARVGELGRQPFTARRFFLRHANRILFGADLLPEISMYQAHYRFFETEDEYFDYPSHASRQGRWQIYGLALPDEALYAIYRGNALSLLRKPQANRALEC